MPQKPRQDDLRPPTAHGSTLRWWFITLALLVLLTLAAWWWFQRQPASPPSAPPPPATPQITPAATQPMPPPEGNVTEPLHPIPAAPDLPPVVTAPENPSDSATSAPTQAPATQATLLQALTQWLGQKNLQSWLQLDDVARRVVATVDNLPRAHAPSRVWPVLPTAGRFQVFEGRIAPANSARYAAFVALAESVNMAQLAALYTRHYPLFQSAYADLGYPNRYFNDRLVTVIDHLLQTPEPSTPPEVVLTEVKGDVPSLRPWVRYEFVDPALQSLSAGQKLLVRMGPDNARRLKARLSELRRLVAKQP